MDVKYLMIGEYEGGTKITMKWARCKTLEDVKDIKELYAPIYPGMKWEVYEVNRRVQ